MKISIKYKILPLAILGVIAIGAIFSYIFIQTQRATSDKFYLNDIQSSKKIFYNLESNDVRAFKIAMTDFMADDHYRSLYKQVIASSSTSTFQMLIDDALPLYQEHKALGVTHFYFHGADGVNVARIHKPDQFGDKIARKTFLASQASQDWGVGLELGATAFALRVVHPYMDDDGKTLIGYIEYGEEIDHFLKDLKAQTGNDYIMAVDKKYINAAQWKGVREGKGLKDNYGDMANYVVIDSTDEALGSANNPCLAEDKLKSSTDAGNKFANISNGANSYVCGGFALYDAGNQKVGTIVTISNTNAEEAALKAVTNSAITITAVMVAVFSAFFLLFLSIIILNPIKKLTKAGNAINDGNLDAPLPDIRSDDEVGDLKNVLETMVGAIKSLRKK